MVGGSPPDSQQPLLRNQRPRTTSIPESTKWSFARGSFPPRSVSRVLSRVTIWETLAWEITNRCAPRCGGMQWRRTNLMVGRVWRRPDPWPRSLGLVRAGRRTRRGRACRADCATSPCGAQAAPPPRTRCRELRSPFSYPKYDYRWFPRQVRPRRARRGGDSVEVSLCPRVARVLSPPRAAWRFANNRTTESGGT